MKTKQQLVSEIMAALRIDGGAFTISMIEESIGDIPPAHYQVFFNALMGDEHAYLKPLDRIAKVARQFTDAKTNGLFAGTREQAKEMYDHFYFIHGAILAHAQDHRDEVPDDKRFFEQINYRTLTVGGHGLNQKELYVLNELGGGSWLFRLKQFHSSKDAIDQIESVIKSAITRKHLAPKHDAIAPGVTKILTGSP